MSAFLAIGVILFCLVHLYPSVLVNSRQMVVGKIGLNPYKGIFSLIVLLSLAMIIYGWRASGPEKIFEPPAWGYLAAQILMYPALFLFISARIDNNIKRLIRHPQASSIFLWGGAHLLASGESRSVVLFGAFSIWALAEIFFLNRRNGAWQKPAALPLLSDIKVALIALVVYTGLAYGHIYFAGTPLTFS